MSAEEEQSQSGYDDGLAGGPGAPTPLTALEVRVPNLNARRTIVDSVFRAHQASQNETFSFS